MSKANEELQNDPLSEMQQQISHLQDKVTYLESRVSDLQQQKVAEERYAAIAHIRAHSYFAQLALQDAAVDNRQNHQFVTNANACIRFARDEANKAITDLASSANPKQLAEDWLNRSSAFFKERGGFNVFR